MGVPNHKVAKVVDVGDYGKRQVANCLTVGFVSGSCVCIVEKGDFKIVRHDDGTLSLYWMDKLVATKLMNKDIMDLREAIDYIP